jgi:hypothetical protein
MADHTLVPVDHNPFKDDEPTEPAAPAIDVPGLMMQIQQAFVMTLEQQARITRDQIANMLQHEENLTEKLAKELVRAITTPKTIVHDKAGRPVGVK